MKVFWGKDCPSEALFFCPGFQREIPDRIYHLPPPTFPKVLKRTFIPEKREWIEMVKKALEEIEKNEIQKVVLSRIVDLELFEKPDPFSLTAALKPYAEGATLFCFQDEKKAFLGASPERLFSREGLFLESEAMAGTRWTSQSFGEKEMREILPVQEHLSQVLTPLSSSPPTFSPIKIHKTSFVEHLQSTCKTEIFPHVTDEEIIAQLHPTPALSGFPQKKALSLIQKMEPMQREFYGSALGWSTKTKAEYRVAIRCCTLRDNRARLQSGVGIVAGSDPELEWEELNQKLKLYEGIFQ